MTAAVELNAAPETRRRRLPQSVGAVFLGFVVVVLLSLGTDHVLHVLGVYPPWGEAMREPGLNLLALSYRCVYAILGSYLAARFAPRNSMRHALALGAIGFVLSIAGAMTAIAADLGPVWYPVALVLTAFPCAWLGGALQRAAQGAR